MMNCSRSVDISKFNFDRGTNSLICEKQSQDVVFCLTHSTEDIWKASSLTKKKPLSSFISLMLVCAGARVF